MYGLGDGLSVDAGKTESVVAVLFEELHVLIGYFDIVLRYLRWKLRWQHNLVALLLPHLQIALLLFGGFARVLVCSFGFRFSPFAPQFGLDFGLSCGFNGPNPMDQNLFFFFFFSFKWF